VPAETILLQPNFLLVVVLWLWDNDKKVMPIPPAINLSWDALPPDISGMPRFVLADEFGNLHMLVLITQDIKVFAIQLDMLGSCTMSSCL
jgi:hypothetical protein